MIFALSTKFFHFQNLADPSKYKTDQMYYKIIMQGKANG